MIGLGTIINTAAIVAAGLLGMGLKNVLPERTQDTVIKGIGACVLFIGISGALPEMTAQENGTLMTILSFALGSLAGAWVDIDRQIERLGAWLKRKSGSENDSRFMDAFITSSMTVCVGAMAIVGSLQDGLHGDYSLLLAKSLLDFVFVMIMSASLGRGCLFSAVPVAILQGSVTLLARFVQPLMTEQALSYLSITGNILIFCVGVNLIWERKMKVANMLPTLIFAVAFSFLF